MKRVFALVLFLSFCIACGGSQRASPTAAPAPTIIRPTDVPLVEESPTPSWHLTKRMFDRITTGMTYANVVDIVGKEGEEISRTDIAGFTTIMYAWQNGGFDMGTLTIMIQNGKVVSKSQFGLK